jgi:hypothetical protein
MTLRQLLRQMIENGDLDKEVQVRIVRRDLDQGGRVAGAKLVEVSRFGRMNLSAFNNEDNFIVIEESDLNNAKEYLP